MNSDRIYKAALIGLGNIAWKFDAVDRENDTDPLTHAGSYLSNPKTTLFGGYSPDPDRTDFEREYGVQTYMSVKDMLETLHPDIVSICSPTEHHFEHTATCIEAGVPMIWLEKPPTPNLAELDRLIELKSVSKGKPKILINYMRRYAKCYQRLREIYLDRVLGEPISMEIVYSRGLILNGSHLLDMAFYLAGADGETLVDNVTTPLGLENPWFFFRLPSGLPVSVVGLPLSYHCADIVVTFEEGRASVIHCGMRTVWEKRIENELFPGFYRLDMKTENPLGLGGMDGSMTGALNDLIQAYEKDTDPVSNLVTARNAQELIDRVFEKVNSDEMGCGSRR
ncbi:MAG: Gfo/Idh/MocA family oxidoreductase [Deltaproteobacteria bacterium]|nr:Gfo/Idh/MocA family oxidoreductase [Deltaproteobacteria bacterium]